MKAARVEVEAAVAAIAVEGGKRSEDGLHAIGRQDQLRIASLQGGACLKPDPAAGLRLVVASCRTTATYEAHKVFSGPPAGLERERLQQGACLRVPPVLLLGSVSSAAPWVESSGVEGGRVIAVGSPNADIKVEGVAGRGVCGGNVEPGLDDLASSSRDVPLWDVLLGRGTLVGA